VACSARVVDLQSLRALEEISADILAIEKEVEELLDGLLKVGAKV